ncbi:MAG TPA: carboxypeptidase-like regulatory domain-containing protein, partial [Chloroflexia bacterium]|nr:carboxypeptidase-like regulatory domain-containing protein [Chloroflexia bacterium]
MRESSTAANKARRRGIALGALGVAGVLLLLVIAIGGDVQTAIGGPRETPTPTSTPIPTETPGPSPTPDAVRPDDIVYVRRFIFGLAGDLYLVHTNGLAPRQITAFTRDQASAASDYPVWNPEHTALAYASEYRDLYNKVVWNLYRIDPEGLGSQQITGLPQPNKGYFPALESKVPGVSVWAMMTAPPGLAVRGRVMANGRPVEGAVVVSWLGRGFARTGADGTYVLQDVPPGAGWIKATGEQGTGWVDFTVSDSGVAAPDIVLDPRLGRAAFTHPAWDPRGGLWSLYSQDWFDPVSQDPQLDTRLVHMNPDGSGVQEVYAATSKTLGRPRANPSRPEQVAVADGTDLLLLTVDLMAPEGQRVAERRVLAQGILRNAPVAWAPDGSKLYYTKPTN